MAIQHIEVWDTGIQFAVLLTACYNAQVLISPKCRDDDKPHRKQWMLHYQ